MANQNPSDNKQRENASRPGTQADRPGNAPRDKATGQEQQRKPASDRDQASEADRRSRDARDMNQNRDRER